MVAVDTNILVRFITNDDKEQSPRARIILEQATPGSLLLDRLILAEVGYVLRSGYGFSKSQIASVYSTLLGESIFFVPNHETLEAAVKLYGSERPLSFEDCYLLALKQTGKVDSVHTFDQNLQKRL